MPNPKRRHSKTRRDKRRTHFKTGIPTYSVCTNCGSTHLYHRVCPECGYYRNNPVIEKKVAV